jgi:hypothetical protein
VYFGLKGLNCTGGASFLGVLRCAQDDSKNYNGKSKKQILRCAKDDN